MKISWISFMVFVHCSVFCTYGQTLLFTGGTGRGSVVQSNVQSTLAGSTDLVKFTGGIGRGNSTGLSSGFQILNGTPNLTFAGGSGRGNIATLSGTLSLSGANLSSISIGGNGQGSARAVSIMQKLDGFAYQSIDFAGGSGRGSSISATFPIFLNGSSTMPSFSGGIGQGHSSKLTSVILLNGSQYEYKFFGGNGRGNILLKSLKLSLNGIVSPGFARIAQSAILDFRAIPTNKKIRLNWKSENPGILDHFVVEKSTDGVDYNSIGFVASGSDHLTGYYSFPHSGNGNDTEYFRLLEVFKDSSFSYSSVLKVATSTENESISLYPNPVLDKFTVTLPESGNPDKIQIFDHSGQLVKDITPTGSSRLEINADDLPAGLYWIETTNQKSTNRIRFTRL